MGDAIGAILRLLEDGEWHDINEILAVTRLSREGLLKVLKFLESFGFIVISSENGCVRLREEVRGLLLRIQRRAGCSTGC
ncbi:hypothetical protein DRO50_03445 [Candidatus Bathyarchaeota archaeon]|nr:MAG: hypothetical protein DRO50_03445 [Candidatus Bathyarchaeota archaeon]